MAGRYEWDYVQRTLVFTFQYFSTKKKLSTCIKFEEVKIKIY